MGTNYYVRTPAEEIHLGKSSAGWTFSFRAYPDDWTETRTWPVIDYASWYRLLSLGKIYDEYGNEVTVEALVNLIERKRRGQSELYRDDFYDRNGNRFTPQEFS